MKTSPVLSLAAAVALSAFTQLAPAAEPPHTQHGGQSPSMMGMGGEQMGGMHEMMQQHMMAMREHGDGHKGYAEIVLKYTADLKLTDEQLGKITRIHQDNQAKVGEIGKKVRESMKAAHDIYLNPSSDEAAIRKAAQDHVAAFNELVETALKSRSAINAVLTPEQLQKLKSLK